MKRKNLKNRLKTYAFFFAFALLLSNSAWAQILVKGQVVDATSKNPMPFVSVSAMGSTVGVNTDDDGAYSITLPQASTKLQFSFVGYKTLEIEVGERTIINVSLESEATSLDQVVVVAFGTQKKTNLTGSVGVVDSKAFEDRPVQNAVQALQGVVPGLNITSQGLGGSLNAGQNINVRGVGTISEFSSGSPLVLIDGIEGDLNSVNPQDIDNISVLKDAASAAVYGSRAPFGVILVTTKKGKTGKAQINYNNSFRWSSPVKLQEMMNSYEFVNYWNETDRNGGGSGQKFKQGFVDKVKDYMDGKLDPTDVVAGPDGNNPTSGDRWNYDYTNANVDWMKEYYRNWAPAQEHTVAISGGAERFRYYLSGNYMQQEGLMRYGTDKMSRYATTIKLSGDVIENLLTIDYSGRFTRTDYDRATTMEDGFYDHIMRRARPIRAITDPNGFYMSDINYINALENGGRRNEVQDWYTQQIKATLTPIEGWNIIGEINYRTYNNFIDENALRVYSYNTDGITPYRALTSVANDYVYNYAKKSNLFSPSLYTNYNITFNEKHNVTALAGFQAEMFKHRLLSVSRKDMISTDVPVVDQTTNSVPIVGGSVDEWAAAGFFGRINYDYDGKYLFEANLRYDGSSRFRKNQRWNLFPSVSAGWNISREGFWEPLLSVVNMLKVRASYGRLGNQNTNGWYPTYQTIGTGTANGGWLINGAKPNTASAPGLVGSYLTWEKIESWNLGLDWGLFNSRLTGSFDYFIRYTYEGMGAGPTLPAVLGTGVPMVNNLDIKTSGFELSINWRDQIGDFSYGVGLNLSDSRTKVLKFPNETQSIYQYMSGRYVNEIWGYQTVGIAKSKEQMDAHLSNLTNGGQGALGSQWDAGDIMYADTDGDGKVNGGAGTLNDKGDLSVIGNSTPRYAIGVNLDFAYKGFDLSMFWQGVLKRDFYASGMMFWGVTSSGEWWSTAMKPHLDYYRDETSLLGANHDSYYPRPIWGGKNQHTQTKYLLDASYLRLKNIQFGYTLPISITEKAKISKLRVFIAGENLLTIDHLNGTLDPESLGIGRQGGTTYPLQKTISFGVNVTF